MKDISFKEITSRFFVFLIGVLILIMLNANGHVFHVLYVGRFMEFFVIVMLLGATIYMALFINKLLDSFKYKFQLQLVVNIVIVIYIIYIWVT
ncbi:hypothetical protein [Alkalibacillus silvisoli]|uniref:DUF4181 domain-containing protein n=1 Tax=Alkalibacillus silvisoli TaxID=392823 RepID=A0ABN0ZQ09_9BACI